MIKNKSKYSILLAVLMLVITSCQDDEFVSESVAVSSGRHIVTLTGVINDETQERAVALSGNFHWNEGDSFSLYDIGSSGDEVPDTAYTFYISDSYSNDSVSSTATFSGECDLENYDRVVAVYPVQDLTGGIADTLTFTISETTAMGTNSDEEIQAYMSANMYMYAYSSKLYNDNVTLSFSHLTCLAKIVYTNETDSIQTINNVSISGDDEYFGTERYLTLTGRKYGTLSTASEVGLTFDGATVAAGESMDFYILFFPSGSYIYDGTLTVTINDESVTMAGKYLSSYMYQGYYYTFNVSQSDDGLYWTNYVTILKETNSLLVDALYSALGSSKSYKDSDGNLLVPYSTIESTTYLNLSNKSLTSLSGLEHFVNLESLYIYKNNLVSIDLSSFPKLTFLSCYSNYLTSLDISNNPLLATLYCYYNDNLTNLDISNHTALTTLECYYCDGLISLDVSGCTSLTTLDSYYCESLESLDATNCSALSELDCKYCSSLTSLVADNCTALTTLNANSCSSMTSLNLSGCSALSTVYCYSCDLSSLNLSSCTSLSKLSCYSNSLTEIDLSDCTALTELYCYDNDLSSLDVSANTKLTTLYCYCNGLTSLDLTNNTSLVYLRCYGNKLSYLDLTETQLSEIYCGGQTDDDGNAITLTLLLTESQEVLWNSTWSSLASSTYYYDINGNHVRAYNSENVEVTVEGSTSDTDDTTSEE